MRVLALLALALAVRPLSASDTNATLRTCRAVRERLLATESHPAPFDITGHIVLGSIPGRHAQLVLNDGEGEVAFYADDAKVERQSNPGDRVRLTGSLRTYENQHHVAKVCRAMPLEGRRKIAPPHATGPQVVRGECTFRSVRVRGRVVDAFEDEIDPGCSYFILHADGCRLYVFVGRSEFPRERMQRLIDATVEVDCLCDRLRRGARSLLGPYLMLCNADDLRVLSAAPADPFAVPPLEDIRGIGASATEGLGRRRISGTVLAVGYAGSFILATDDGRTINADAADSPPPCGAHIEVCGRVSTDVYHINLHRTLWRADGGVAAVRDVRPVTTGELLTDTNGETMIKAEYHGQPVRLEGIVRSLPAEHSPSRCLHLESGGVLVPVDPGPSGLPFAGLELGMRLAVAGICSMEIAPTARRDSFPRIGGFSLVIRSPADITVLAHPSWWTPQRLAALSGALLALLVGFGAWNIVLNRLVEHRSRELMRTHAARDEARLKTEERMRLAVELHDTIAQEMTGVAMQLDAAELAAESEPGRLGGYLASARLRLRSCRDNLRNCLWDLRNRPFETRLLADAVRRTLSPHLGEAQLSVASDLTCREFSDSAIHAVLCILRELAVNAVRHGKAGRIAISAERAADGIALRVTDDGVGFDPDARPGPSQGHFGLQGVMERVNRLDGAFDLESAPTRGTTVTITHLNSEA